jgi:hypothetical protein
MNKWRYFWPALLVGALAVGPMLSYIGTLVKFGLGFTSSAAFTTYAVEKIMTGLVAGAICAAVCASNKADPLRTAGRVAIVTTGVLLSVTTITQLFIRTRDLIGLRPLFGSLIVDVWTMFFIAYLTSELTRRWIVSQDEAKPVRANHATSLRR